MKSKSGRAYQMVARAEATARTTENILKAFAELWRERSVDSITLEAMAERAGVSKRTVLRCYGSKEGVIAAAIKADSAGIVDHRRRVATGDVQGALDVLLSHYERDGDAVLRTLLIEKKLPDARMIIEAGRQEHRAWCARVFAPYLPSPKAKTYDQRLDAFIAATDLYLWKLLRHDLKRSAEETRRTFSVMLEALKQASA